MVQALVDIDDDDIIMMSDVDEIPSAYTVEDFQISCLNIAVVEQDYYCYYFNCHTPHKWRGTTITRGAIAKKYTPQVLRDSRDDMPGFGSGWHFGYLGGLDQIKLKLTSFSHEEYADMSEEHIQAKLDNMQDLYQNVDFTVIDPIDERLPKYLRNNQETFKHLIRYD